MIPFEHRIHVPGNIRSHLLETAIKMESRWGRQGQAKLIIQGLTGLWLILALAFHLAAVGMIGLSVIVLLTALNGIVEEHQLGHAFKEALPFTALLVVFFTILAVIHDQHLFRPVISYVLNLKGNTQLAAYYIANGLLSMISDNVFVATVYISETKMHITDALGLIPDIGMSGAQLMDKLTAPHTARSEVFAALPPSVAIQAKAIMDQFDKLAVEYHRPAGHLFLYVILERAAAPNCFHRFTLLKNPDGFRAHKQRGQDAYRSILASFNSSVIVSG